MDGIHAEAVAADTRDPAAGAKVPGAKVVAKDTEARQRRVPEPMASRKCRNYARKEASKVWNVIIANLLDKAAEASVPHITLVVKLAGFEQGPMAPHEPKRRGKSLAQQLREEMEELEARNIAEFGE